MTKGHGAPQFPNRERVKLNRRGRYQGDNLDAAVITPDHPDANNQARVVPLGAQLKKMGGVVAGYYKASRSLFVMRSRRAHEIEKLFGYRYPAADGVLPFPEDEVAFASALIAHAAPVEARAALVRWGVELKPEIEQILSDPVSRTRKWTAEELGRLVGLTSHERTLLGITTYRAIDQTSEEQAEARRARDRDRKCAARAAQQCGRAERLSIAQLQPWKAEGMSRRTWYRKGLHKKFDLADFGTGRVRSNISREVGADRSSASSARNAILATLVKPLTVRQIVELTGLAATTVSPLLSRLKNEGDVKAIRRGTWAITAAGSARAAIAHRPKATTSEPNKKAPSPPDKGLGLARLTARACSGADVVFERASMSETERERAFHQFRKHMTDLVAALARSSFSHSGPKPCATP